MQYSIFEGKRVEAFTGGRAECPICANPTIAKCGTRLVHHWAHLSLKDCDNWWENETEWHRSWKNLFPPFCRELGYTAQNGEVHRADVVTPGGVVIEFQHSAMDDTERLSRETFYKNLVWVIDGRSFKNNFHIYHALPDPCSNLSKDIVWHKAKHGSNGANSGIFFRISETQLLYPEELIIKGERLSKMVQIHSIREIFSEIQKNYIGHHQYDWLKPRKTWLEATCPVYIDLGNSFLYRLDEYDASKLNCVRLVTKSKFLRDAMIQVNFRDIGTKTDVYYE